MKNITKTKILFISALLILLALTACSNKAPEPEKLTNYGADIFDPGFRQSDKYIAGCGGDTNGQIYMIIDRPSDDPDDFDPRHTVFRISEDGIPGEIIMGDKYLDEGTEGRIIYLENLQIGEKGSIWITGSVAGGGISHEFLWHVNQNGEDFEGIKSADRINLTELQNELSIDRIDGVFADSENWIYMISGDKIYVLNHWQKHQFTLKAENGTQTVRLGNGQAGFFLKESGEVRSIDKTAQDWGESCKLPENVNKIYPGNGGNLFFCTSDEILYGWNAEKNTPEIILNWLEMGINAVSVSGFSIREDGKIILGIHEDNTVQTGVLTPGAETVEKTVLTLAALGINSGVARRAAEFNRTSKTCRIVCKDYYKHSGPPSADASRQARQRLMTEIAAGDVPDLIDLDGLPLRRYGTLGYLEDLWPYIENDPDLGRDGVMEHALACAEVDGKLYTVSRDFVIRGLVGAKSVVGDRIGWTFDELLAAFENMPEGSSLFTPGTSKSDILKTLFSLDLESYIDWETGICYFNTEEFKDILSFCNTVGADAGDPSDWYLGLGDLFEELDLAAKGRLMLMDGHINNFLQIQKYETILGGEVSYTGSPSRDGGCGCYFILDTMGMTAACKDKAAAWEFLRQYLLPYDQPFDYSEAINNRFPINRQSFEALWERSSTPVYDKDGREEPKSGEAAYWEKGEPPIFDVDYYAAAPAHYDQIMELYNAIDSIYRRDTDLWSIIGEQALPYFAGDKSLDETAELIQGRVELYVNERM